MKKNIGKIVRKRIKAPNRLSAGASAQSKKTDEYESDFYKWVNTQAKLLKKEEFSKLDMKNLIEEIESLGRSEKRTLRSYLEILLMHKLKWEYQPGMRTNSWTFSIEESLHKAQVTLSENPSLKSKLKEIFEDAYYSARYNAAVETTLDVEIFPKECPWTLSDIFPDLEKKHKK